MLNARSDAENPFVLDMVFNSSLSKEDEGAVSLRKNMKLFWYLGTALFSSFYLISSILYQEHKNKSWEIALIAAGTTVTYGVFSVWIFLHLEKELLSGEYSEQRIEKEKNLFKAGKHLLSWILTGICVSFIAIYSRVTALGNGFFNAAAGLYSFYFLLSLSNNIQAIYSEKISKSVAIMNTLTLIIEEAIPVLLKMTKEERKTKISEIYNALDKKSLSLITMLKQLKQIEPEKTSLFENHRKWKEVSPTASILFSTIFNIANIVAAYVYYEKKRCYDYYTNDNNMDDYFGDCQGINTRPEVMMIITVWMPASLMLTALAAHQTFNRLLAIAYKKETQDAVSQFYPKASYFILLLAYICSSPLLTPFFTNKTAYPLDFSYIGKGNLWYLPYQIFFTATFYLIFVPVVFDFVFRSLINNYLEMYGDEEQKDAVRLVNFLNHIKENILQKAKPELVNEFFDTTEGQEILTGLGVKSEQVLEKKNIEERESGSSLSTKESFFYEDPRSTLIKNSERKAWCAIM